MKRVSPADLEAALAGSTGRVPRGGPDRIEAAVCVPIMAGPDGLRGWCIKRPDGLRHHSREIAFPGGKPEPGDAGLVGTALRETEEEVGVARARLRVIGTLTPVPTATSRFTLNPVVVEVLPGAEPRPNPGEVEQLISFRLDDIFEGRVPYSAVDIGPYISPIFEFSAGSMYGATAHVLLELLEVYGAAAGLAIPVPRMTTTVPWA